MVDNIQKLNFVAKVHDFVRTKVADGINNTPKHLPGHVSKILPNDFVEFTIDATGPYTLPVLTIPQAFSKYHREPTKVGDKGYAIGSSINIGGSSGNDGSTANMYSRGNLTTGTFHPISNKKFPERDPNQFLITGGSSGHKVQSENTKTSTTIDDKGSGKIDHVADKGITAKATNGDIATSATTGDVTHAAAKGSMKLVADSLTIGKAADPNAFPPVPSLPTVMNIIGSMSASGNSNSSGTMSAAGGIVGDSTGAAANPGIVREVISSVVNTPVTLGASLQVNIASITLTPGDWDVQGNVWMVIGPTASANVAIGISTTSSVLATVMALNMSRTQIYTSIIAAGIWISPTGPCRALVTVNTTYYLVGFSETAATATGYLWARRC